MSDIKNAERLIKKLNHLGSRGQDIVYKGIARATTLVYDEAQLRAPSQSGELKQAHIKQQVKRVGGQHIEGVVSTNAYGVYVEFGTGPKGQADHAGVAPIGVTYRSTPWYIHKDQVKGPYKFLERGDYYLTYGQKAQPFLYPAWKSAKHRGLLKKATIEYVKREVDKLVK